jgi:hypothetical protein
MRIFYSLLGVIIGFLLIRYNVQLTESLGRIEWAENYLKSGMAGTYTMYRLIGLILIILSLLYVFGLFGFILGPLAPLFGGSK